MPKTSLDDVDIKILSALQEDGRLSNIDLAGQLNLSASPCLRRTKILESNGVIRGYRAEIDRTKVGLGLTVLVSLKVREHSRDNAEQLGKGLLQIPEVVSCHMVSGEADFFAEVVVADLSAYERLLTGKILTLPMVSDVRSNFVLRAIKNNGPLKLPSAPK